jgi:hypothetical protein
MDFEELPEFTTSRISCYVPWAIVGNSLVGTLLRISIATITLRALIMKQELKISSLMSPENSSISSGSTMNKHKSA